MKMTYARSISALVAVLLINSNAFATVVVGSSTQFTDVSSATEIDPSGGATIAKDNASWSSAFTSSGSGTYTAVSSTEFTALNYSKFILNFESSNGFGTATQTIKSDGTIFTETGKIGPFTTANSISSIATTSGLNIGVSGRTFTYGTGVLGAAGSRSVFLVGDRSANDTMTSGTQGLTVGNYNGSQTTGVGAYLQFGTSLSYFCVTLNNNSSTSGGWSPYIALFDSAGSVVAAYTLTSVSGESIYFGVNIEGADVQSVWIGNKSSSSTANFNGVIIDDIGFLTTSQIPEPANAAVMLGAAMLLCVLLGRKTSIRTISRQHAR